MPIAAALLMLLGAARFPPPERAAPPVFASVTYGLTFRAPPGSYYCPLQRDWTGSDHGTVMFLGKPKACFGAGGVSSVRGFAPGKIPRIEIDYEHALDPEDRGAPRKCTLAGHVMLFDRARNLCVVRLDGVPTYVVDADYDSDGAETLSVRLVTSDLRRDTDLATLRRFLAGVRACHSSEYRHERRRDGHILPNCPEGDWY